MRQLKPSTNLLCTTHTHAAVASTEVHNWCCVVTKHSPVNEVMGAQLPSDWAASATSHSFRVLSVDALMTWLLPTQRT